LYTNFGQLRGGEGRLNNGCFFGARYAQRRRGERALSALADVPGGYTGAVRRTRLALRRDTSAQP
jgi:hypothetical protein